VKTFKVSQYIDGGKLFIETAGQLSKFLVWNN